MKKLLTLIAAAAVSASSFLAAAQGRNEINLYIGGVNSTYASLDRNSGNAHRDLYSIYEPSYTITCGPTWSLDYCHRFNSWLGIGFQADYASMSGSKSYRIGSISNSSLNLDIISVLPQAKFYIPSPRHFRMYTKAAFGANFNVGNAGINDPVTYAWEVSPFGFEWGGQVVYGQAELCFGNVLVGAKIGIGYRF